MEDKITTIKNELVFAFFSLKQSLKNALAMRKAVGVQVLAMFINNFAFIIVWGFLFQKFQNINGWSGTTIIGFLGVHSFAYGISFSVFDGISNFYKIALNGRLDDYILSPKNIFLSVATSRCSLYGLGDLLFGVICIGIYFFIVGFSFWKLCLMLLLTIPSAILFSSINIFGSILALLISNKGIVDNVIWEIFMSTSMYPGGLWQGAMRNAFIFLLPSLVVGSIPFEAVAFERLQYIPLIFGISLLWLIIANFTLKAFLKRYESGNEVGLR